MSKKCSSCNDGICYPRHKGICPICRSFLVEVDDSSENNYSNTELKNDIFDDWDSAIYENDFNDNCNTNQTSMLDDWDKDIDNDKFSKEHIGSDNKKYKRNSYRLYNYNNHKNKFSQTIVEGIVKNITFDRHGNTLFRRLFDALFKFENFVLSNDITFMQLYTDDNNYEEIIIKGKILQGKIAERNKIRVRGRRNLNGCIISNKIILLGSNVRVMLSTSINPFILWSVIISIYIFIRSIDWFSLIASSISILLELLSPLILIYIFIKIIFKNIRF